MLDLGNRPVPLLRRRSRVSKWRSTKRSILVESDSCRVCDFQHLVGHSFLRTSRPALGLENEIFWRRTLVLSERRFWSGAVARHIAV